MDETCLTSSSSCNSIGGVVVHEPAPNENEVRRLLDKYNYDLIYSNKQYTYGTAGFRYIATELAPIMVRIGIVAAIEATIKCPTNVVGIMITASHNDESYNGIKIAQSPDGGMLNSHGELLATTIVNERNPITLWNIIYENLHRNNSNSFSSNPTTTIGIVHIGYDTREHSKGFSCLVRKVVTAMGCYVYDHGIVTTPMLHHCVKHTTPQYIPSLIPSRPYVTGYYDLLINSYCSLLRTRQQSQSSTGTTNINTTSILNVDCACGVGYEPIQYIANHKLLATKSKTSSSSLHSSSCTTTQIVPFNGPGTGPLNDGCGSEYVQKDLTVPRIYNDTTISFDYCASIDGDADRIVFFYLSNSSSSQQQQQQQQLRLLDGDKIATLVCQFVKEQLNILQQQQEQHQFNESTCKSETLTSISIGVVQTAYANGASTNYLRTILGSDNVLIAKTGVKYVHEMAHSNFDIGIYFEANGHGTILFGSKFYKYMYQWEQQLLSNHFDTNTTTTTTTTTTNQNKHYRPEVYTAYQRLRILPGLVNQAVGDAISDLLLIDAILQLSSMTIQQWDSIYTDLPSRQGKVKVKDRTIIITNDNETRCLQPDIVQTKLDEAVQSIIIQQQQQDNDDDGITTVPARAFIRPSGTENVVRVYAEASTRQLADTLANYAIDIVYDYCDGIDEKPTFPIESPIISKL